jgi:hypothetical protein
MGYAMRTRRWRYIEWVRFAKGSTKASPAGGAPRPIWDQLLGTELYDHTVGAVQDSVENVAESINRVAEPALAATVAQLSAQLRAGWRAARPPAPEGEGGGGP